jgi:hypothetical protein
MAETHTTCFFTGININRVWKDDKTWFGQYAATYATATLNGSTPENAPLQQNVADTGRLIPGTQDFSRL